MGRVRANLAIVLLGVAVCYSNSALSQISVTFDHSTASKSQPIGVSLSLGEKFDVKISNTVEEKFDYSVRGFEVNEFDAEEAQRLGVRCVL